MSSEGLERPSFYAIIPAHVRYDNELTNGAKLLYGEITALSNQEGHCWATNAYFSKLYAVKPTTISVWVSKLEEKGHIKRVIKYKEGTKQIESRFLIPLTDPYIEKSNDPYIEKSNDPIQNNLKGNSTSTNTTSNNICIQEIFNYWNDKEIIKHRELTKKRSSSINARLKSYTVDELKLAVDNYQEVLDNEKYYWTHKYNLEDFMNPRNLERFTKEAKPFDNFLSNNYQSSNKKVAKKNEGGINHLID